MSDDPYEYDDMFIDLMLFGGKVCSHCGRTLPANTERFNRDHTEPDGLTVTCRQCRAASARQRYYTPAGEVRRARRRALRIARREAKENAT